MAKDDDTLRCPHAASCGLFPQFRLSSNLSIWMDRYCRSAYPSCERYKLSLSGKPVPDHLLPNGALLRKIPPKL
jgi:hypothetical protein